MTQQTRGFRVAATATAMGTVVVVLAGCGAAGTPTARPPAAPSGVVGPVGSSSPPAPAPTATVPIAAAPAATATASATASPAPTTTAAVTSAAVPTGQVAGHPVPVVAPTATVVFTGEAAAEFGADKVQAAYRVATGFALRTTFNGGTVVIDKPRRLDVSYADDYLTPAGNKRLDTAVASAAAGDNIKLFTLTTYKFSNLPKYGLTARFPYTAQTRAGLATTSVYKADGQADRLDIRFQVSGYLLFDKNDKTRQRILVTKDVRYFMVPVETGGKAGWLVDDWFATVNASLPQPDPSP